MSKLLTKDTILYSNDLKHKHETKITLDKLKHMNHPILDNICNLVDMDTLKYRISECVSSKYNTLDLSGLQLTHLPLFDDSLIYTNVINLFCSNNNLTDTYSLHKFTNLLVLDISGNMLTSIANLPKSCDELVCRNNKITHLDIPNNLRLLDVSYNKLKSIPTNDMLTNIICSNNMITEINSYYNLKHLNCSNNLVKHIDSMDNLKFLDCSYNKLTTINTFDKLHTLYCSNNMINKINNLNSLERIECINIKLGCIPYFPLCKIVVCDNNIELDIKYKSVSKTSKVDSFNNLTIEFEL